MDSVFDDLKATAFSIWNRRWLALAVAWGVCLIGWLVVALIPNTFESHARVYVQMHDPVAAQVGLSDTDRQHDIDRVRDTLTSREHLEKVVRSTPLGDRVTTQKQMDAAVLGLSNMVKINNDQDSLFEITATSRSMGLSDRDSALLARQIVQRMIDIFRDENNGTNLGEMKNTMGFIEQQLIDRQRDLAAAEQHRMDFEQKHPEMAQGGISMIQRLEQDREQLRSLDSDIAAAQSSFASVSGQLAGTPATIAVAGPQGGTRGELAQAQADLQAMRARGMTENHPDVIAQHQLIASLRAQASTQGPVAMGGAPNPTYSSLQSVKADRQAAIVALQGRRAVLQQDIDQVSAQQNANPDLVAEAQGISRDYEVLKQQYDKLLQSREDLRLKGQVASADNGARFQVIDPPSLPRAPTAPNRPLFLAGVLIAGIAAGIGAAFGLGELKGTFGTTSKLTRVTGMPVLGAVSEAVAPAARAERARKVRTFAMAGAALGGVFVLLLAMELLQRGVAV